MARSAVRENVAVQGVTAVGTKRTSTLMSDPTEYIDWDEPEYTWEPHCVDDCELCGCHGECDPEDPWSWRDNHDDDEMYEEADSVPYEEE